MPNRIDGPAERKIERSKYERLLSLTVQVLRLEMLRGHLRWKVTELSRGTRMSRSRIYELLGPNKPLMLENALKCLLEEIYGLSSERAAQREKLGPVGGITLSRQMVLENPELLIFYIRHRARPDEIGQMIRRYERKYTDLLAQQTGLRNEDDLLFVRAAAHGIGTAAFLTDAEVSMCLRKLFAVAQAGLPPVSR